MDSVLNDLIWKSFRFDEIFEINEGYYNKKPKIITESNEKVIPFIGASAFNNGITGYCLLEDIKNTSKSGKGKNHPLESKIFKGNCITVTNNGSVGNAYYQEDLFTCSHDISVLYLKDYELNRSIALFLIVQIEKTGRLFSYARKWRPMRMKSSNIWLPVDEDEKPNYKFMEEYIINLKKDKITKSKEYILDKLNNLEYKEIELLSEKQWGEFYISNIFETLQRGKRLIKNNFIEGEIPYVSSTANNNGIDAFIGNTENVRIFSDCLTLANSGSVGSTFYHPYTFVASDHVTHLKNDNFNKYVYLFIAIMTQRLAGKYNFNREINDARLKRETIILPVDKEGNPDYGYMEQYVKNTEITLLKKYLNTIK